MAERLGERFAWWAVITVGVAGSLIFVALVSLTLWGVFAWYPR